MTKSKNLVFFGTEEFSLHTLKHLVENDWKISLVVTKPDSRKGRGRIFAPSAVKQFAVENALTVAQPVDTKELKKIITKYKASSGVLSAYGKIIPQPVLDLFSNGIINVHPSLLPMYRGASPIEQAILNGDKKTGVSIMKLVAKMDAGPIYKQQAIRLFGNETASELYDKLGELGAKLLCDNLENITSGKLKPKDQDEDEATLAPMINKQDGQIEWNETGKKIERQIRAYNVWPQSRTTLGGKDVILTDVYFTSDKNEDDKVGDIKSEIIKEEGLSIIKVTCLDGTVNIRSLKPVGKREMTAGEFLAGNQL